MRGNPVTFSDLEGMMTQQEAALIFQKHWRGILARKRFEKEIPELIARVAERSRAGLKEDRNGKKKDRNVAILAYRNERNRLRFHISVSGSNQGILPSLLPKVKGDSTFGVETAKKSKDLYT